MTAVLFSQNMTYYKSVSSNYISRYERLKISLIFIETPCKILLKQIFHKETIINKPGVWHDVKILNKKIHSHEFGTQSDVFIINREGILQTPSLFYGKILEKCELDVPLYIRKTSVKHENDNSGNMIIFGSAYLENSPFILIVTRRSEDFLANLFEVRIKLR